MATTCEQLAEMRHLGVRSRSSCKRGTQGQLGTAAARPLETIWWRSTFCRLVGSGGPCEKNCSFVSSAASAAFWTIAPAALAPPGWRALAYTAAIAFGVIISTSRMIMGGHFLSGTIFSGLFTFLVISVVYGLIYPRPRTRMDDAAVEMAIARFSIYGRTAISRLLGY